MAKLTLIIRHGRLLMGQRTYIFSVWSMDPGSRPGCSESQRKKNPIYKRARSSKSRNRANCRPKCQRWHSLHRSKRKKHPALVLGAQVENLHPSTRRHNKRTVHICWQNHRRQPEDEHGQQLRDFVTAMGQLAMVRSINGAVQVKY